MTKSELRNCSKRPKLREKYLPSIVIFAAIIKTQLIMAAIDNSWFYDLEGLLIYRGPRRDAILQKGIYIVRQGNTVRKITVR